jgi:dTDP-4-amino-4,6-dideoxygalactose transaminase
VSSGTAGLHLCVRLFDIKDGDWVITTPFSFVSSTNVLLYERSVPIFVDVDPISGNIDAEQVSAAVKDLTRGGKAAERWLPRRGSSFSGKLKAVLGVDVFGQPLDADPLRAICHQYGIAFIEDACEALGASYKGRNAGTLGDIGVFAFYPNKQITTAEGGMIVTDDDEKAALARALRNQGRAVGDTWLQHTYLGYNYRMDELSAALGVVQMQRLEELIAKRERVAAWYKHYLGRIDGIELPKVTETTTRMSWFVFVIRLDSKLDRDLVAKTLSGKGYSSPTILFAHPSSTLYGRKIWLPDR